MTMDKKAALTILTALMLLTASAAAGSDQMQLTADTLQYDPSGGIVFASGHVKVVGRGAEITSVEGEFDPAGTRSLFRKNVLAQWPDGSLTMDCDEMILEETPRGQKIIARKVTRFHDPVRKVTVRADMVEGLVVGGVFTEFDARGGVVADAVAPDGEPTRVSGGRSRYSRDRRTLEFTGGAVGVQKNRRITADTFIIHLESGKIEAVGSPRMEVDLPSQEPQ